MGVTENSVLESSWEISEYLSNHIKIDLKKLLVWYMHKKENRHMLLFCFVLFCFVFFIHFLKSTQLKCIEPINVFNKICCQWKCFYPHPFLSSCFKGILVQVRSEIISDPNAQLDDMQANKPYSEDEARRAFARMVQRYGWNKWGIKM